MNQYTLADFEPVEQPDVWRCPNCDDEAYESYESAARHHLYCTDEDIHFLHDYFGKQLGAAYLNGRSTNELSDILGPDGKTIRDALASIGVQIRDTSTATKVWFERLSEEEQARIAHEDQQEAIEVLSDWRDKNAEKHRQNARENLPEAKSGPENWCWKGGKCLRDNLTRTYGDDSWSQQRRQSKELDDYTCAVCGEQKEGGQIHTHHIVPILAGGTNHPDNLMTVCRGCHRTVEDYTWAVPEVGPVFEE